MRDIGYVDANLGFSADSCAVLTAVHAQSPDIAMGVDRALETRDAGETSTGAGDQGMMFGFACDETPELMPLPISLAHGLSRRLAQVRKEGVLPWLRPDGKCQVTVVYEDGAPVAVDTVVLSAQHDESVGRTQLEKSLLDAVIHEAVPARLWTPQTKVYINPDRPLRARRTGRGYRADRPQDHRGHLRRLRAPRRRRVQRQGPLQGGPAPPATPPVMSPSIWWPKGWPGRAEVALAYAIGVAKPVSVQVNTFGTGVRTDELLSHEVMERFDLSPDGIIRMLDLRRPIYRQTAAYGHFGRPDLDLPWEALD